MTYQEARIRLNVALATEKEFSPDSKDVEFYELLLEAIDLLEAEDDDKR